MNRTLQVWRQKSRDAEGGFAEYPATDISAMTLTAACTRTACTSKPLRAKIPASLAIQSGKTPAESETYAVVVLLTCA